MGWAEGEGPASTPQEIMIANVFLSSPALGTIKWGEPAAPERAGIWADIHIIPVHSPAGSHTSGLCGRRKTGLRRGLQENWFSVENNERVRGAGARALNHTASVPHERPKPHNTEIKAIRFFTPLLLPRSPPPLAATLHTRLTISRIGPKEEGWNGLFAFAFSSGPPNAARLHWTGWRILLKQQHGINVASVLLDLAAKRAWLFWDDNVRVKLTWCGDGIKGYTWKRRAARVQLCVPLWSIICMHLVQAWKHWAGCFENASKPLSY